MNKLKIFFETASNIQPNDIISLPITHRRKILDDELVYVKKIWYIAEANTGYENHVLILTEVGDLLKFQKNTELTILRP